MKADLNSIKRELSRLANVEYLKKELNRIAHEVKNFDEYIPLNNQAKKRLTQLERRFRDLMKSVGRLQQQIDSNLSRFLKSMRGSKAAKTARSSTKRSAGKASGKTAKKNHCQESCPSQKENCVSEIKKQLTRINKIRSTLNLPP